MRASSRATCEHSLPVRAVGGPAVSLFSPARIARREAGKGWQVTLGVVVDRIVNPRTGDELFVLDVESPCRQTGFRATLVVRSVPGVRLGSLAEVGGLLTVEVQFRRRAVRLPAHGSAIHRFLVGFAEFPMMLC